MPTSSPLRRSVYGLAAATVLTLTLSGPASARPMPENPPTPASAVSAQVPAQPHQPGPPSYNHSWLGWSRPSTVSGPVEAAGGSADTLQYLQIGLGALSGAALTVGALTVAARNRRGRLTHA